MSLGLVNIGAAAPPDMNMASIIATAFAILSNANAETALTICHSDFCARSDDWYLTPNGFIKFQSSSRYIDQRGEVTDKHAEYHILLGPILYFQHVLYFRYS